MVSLGVVRAVVVIFGVALSAGAAAPTPVPELDRKAAIERATREGKPIVLFSRSATCGAGWRGANPCNSLERAAKHSAIQRRLERVVYLKVETEESTPSVSVLDPGGRPVVRWAVPPDASAFRQMLTLVDGASSYILKSYRSRMAGDAAEAAREECLATLALGDEALGRTRLLALRASADAETRELATIWLGWFDARMNGAPLDERALASLAKDGSTDRVRFEAWMNIGESRLAKGRTEDAAAAFRAALEKAPESEVARDAAHAALARSAEAAPPVIGLGPPGSIVAGLRTIQPKWNASRTARVEYRLDGRLVATALQSPYAAAVRFDRLPTRRLLELSAIDSQGKVIRSGSVVVNDRAGAFAIQIVEPAGETLSGLSAVELAPTVPRGRSIDEIVVEWNGKAIARLESPPWKTTVEADGTALGVLRVVVRLDDGQEREDVRLFNTGEMLLSTGVHLVEVPVYDANRNLQAGDVIVKEAGVTRPVDRVISPSEASLDVALLLDMSTSMKEYVLDLEEAALSFVRKSLEERARVSVVAFDTTARIALWPTSDREPIERAIQGLNVRGATALHDAMITAILQLQAGGSRRAIVVLSDGIDNASAFSMSDVLEVARRNAVPVYVVILNPVVNPVSSASRILLTPPEVEEQEALARLARSSGGMAFELGAIGRAGSIWQKIADDLRKQSLVIYRTSGESGGWRKLDVSLRRGRALRAPAGVFVDAGGAAEERK